MHEKKRCGEYHVLNRTDSVTGDTLTKKLTINEGRQISYQVHDHRKEIWTIVEGEGILYLDGKKQKVGCGDVATIEAGVKHGLHALTDLSVIEVQFGKPLLEEDIIRVELEWSPTLPEEGAGYPPTVQSKPPGRISAQRKRQAQCRCKSEALPADS
jgi:mannose-1-phosphate guanylyltransferase